VSSLSTLVGRFLRRGITANHRILKHKIDAARANRFNTKLALTGLPDPTTHEALQKSQSRRQNVLVRVAEGLTLEFHHLVFVALIPIKQIYSHPDLQTICNEQILGRVALAIAIQSHRGRHDKSPDKT
jgi:hypothetical protein